MFRNLDGTSSTSESEGMVEPASSWGNDWSRHTPQQTTNAQPMPVCTWQTFASVHTTMNYGSTSLGSHASLRRGIPMQCIMVRDGGMASRRTNSRIQGVPRVARLVLSSPFIFSQATKPLDRGYRIGSKPLISGGDRINSKQRILVQFDPDPM